MEDLVLLAKRWDADAFTELMQSQMQNMYKTARALLEDDEDAADAISDTILACWEKMDQLKNPEYFRTWMTRILINKCNDILRKKKELYLMGDKPQEIPFSSQEYDNVEWLETLKGLDEKYRLILILYYVNGLKTPDISAVLHIPISTVRTRLSRARDQLALLYNLEA
ncbi:MAG: sigma-70 family RNA polymerase sigma factor [Lachnospiraceae bacterium]|nr:sigma-70 family RNA polymerase sigma factor [Lachnospiraceae bacterium]